MMKILTLGNALVDHIIRVASDPVLAQLKLPKGSMTLVDAAQSLLYRKQLEGAPFWMASGGSAANTARGIARLGLECGYIGKLGKDAPGEFFLNDLIKNGVKPHIGYSDTDTGVALTLISPDSERTFATYLGAAIELDAGDLDPDVFAEYDLLHMEGYLVQNRDLFLAALEMAADEGLLISLDLASYNVVAQHRDFLREELPGNIDILFANESEIRALSGAEDLLKIREAYADFYPQLIIKTGAEGCLIAAEDQRWAVPAVEAKVIDTNGAGDLFAAAYLSAYARGHQPPDCARLGNYVAARVIEVIGTGIPEDGWNKIYQEFDEILR